MAEINDQISREVVQEARHFGVLAGRLDLHLWVFKDELAEFVHNSPGPGKQNILFTFNDILAQINNLTEFQRMCMNRNEQRALLNSVAVEGLPEEYTSSTETLAATLTRLLHIRIEPDVITRYERVGDITRDGKPRVLAVHFIDRNIKNRVLHVVEYGALMLPGYDMPINIIDNLTKMNRELLRKARQEALKLNISRVWVENGKIYIQRSETSQRREIKSSQDIDTMNEF